MAIVRLGWVDGVLLRVAILLENRLRVQFSWVLFLLRGFYQLEDSGVSCQQLELAVSGRNGRVGP